MNAWSLFVGTIGTINILLAIIIVFLERRNISSTWAWLMILWFVPIIGFLLYLLLGQQFTLRRIFRWDRNIHSVIRQQVAEQKQLLQQSDHRFANETVEAYRQLVYLHLTDNESILT